MIGGKEPGLRGAIEQVLDLRAGWLLRRQGLILHDLDGFIEFMRRFTETSLLEADFRDRRRGLPEHAGPVRAHDERREFADGPFRRHELLRGGETMRGKPPLRRNNIAGARSVIVETIDHGFRVFVNAGIDEAIETRDHFGAWRCLNRHGCQRHEDRRAGNFRERAPGPEISLTFWRCIHGIEPEPLRFPWNFLGDFEKLAQMELDSNHEPAQDCVRGRTSKRAGAGQGGIGRERTSPALREIEPGMGAMPPAARLSDMHVCPAVTGVVPHVGGPIITPCCPTVLIGGLPAARVTDQAVCAGPPDIIVKGSATVMIGGLPAARIGDMTAHGGVIVAGLPTVMIGG